MTGFCDGLDQGWEEITLVTAKQLLLECLFKVLNETRLQQCPIDMDTIL